MDIEAWLNKYFTLTADETFYFDEKLLPKDVKIDKNTKLPFTDIFKNDISYNVIAPLNSGKTYSTLSAAYGLEILTLLLVPLTAIGTNLKNKNSDRFPILFIHGGDPERNIPGVSPGEIDNFLSNKNNYFIVCVYDSLKKLIEHPSFSSRIGDCNLVIDESHNLVAQSNFRYLAIHKIMQNYSRFRKTMFLTGTPELTILNGFATIEFKHRIPNQHKQRINIIDIGESNSSCFHMIVDHMLATQIIGKTVLLAKTKKQLKNIEKGLIASRQINSDEIKVLHSKEKSSSTFEYLMNAEQLPEHVRFILSTSVISDGVNIYDDNVANVYFLDVEDIFLKRQFIGRFRTENPVRVAWDFFRPQNYLFKHKYDLLKNEKQELITLGKRCENLNCIPKDMQVGSIFQQDKMKYEVIKDRESKHPIVYVDNGPFSVSSEIARKLSLEKISKFIHSQSQNLKSFYEVVCNMTADVVDYGTFIAQFGTSRTSDASYYRSVQSLMQVDLSDKNQIEIHLNKLLDSALKLNPQVYSVHDLVDARFRDPDTPEDFKDQNKSLITSGKKVFKTCFEFLNRGFSFAFVKEYMKLYYDKEAKRNYIDLDHLKNILFIYQDYCAFDILDPLGFDGVLELLTREVNYPSLGNHVIIHKLRSYALGPYNRKNLIDKVKQLIKETGITNKQHTAMSFIDAVFENTKSSRRATLDLSQINLKSLNTINLKRSEIAKLPIIQEFNENVMDLIKERWSLICAIGCYYNLLNAQKEQPDLFSEIVEVFDFLKRLRMLCTSAREIIIG